jgi:hypothetical protein
MTVLDMFGIDPHSWVVRSVDGKTPIMYFGPEYKDRHKVRYAYQKATGRKYRDIRECKMSYWLSHTDTQLSTRII